MGEGVSDEKELPAAKGADEESPAATIASQGEFQKACEKLFDKISEMSHEVWLKYCHEAQEPEVVRHLEEATQAVEALTKEDVKAHEKLNGKLNEVCSEVKLMYGVELQESS